MHFYALLCRAIQHALHITPSSSAVWRCQPPQLYERVLSWYSWLHSLVMFAQTLSSQQVPARVTVVFLYFIFI